MIFVEGFIKMSMPSVGNRLLSSDVLDLPCIVSERT
jgi:hypothetical protein